ncbi:hypothetical protein [Botrimarina sp.]|uniref:hypothetical protein n=1 Tax=Botrimarina sp. TaxID=2795802 RepID=UPI0032EBC587
MPFDPYFARGPSDSGLLDDAAAPPGEPVSPCQPRAGSDSLPSRELYTPPPPSAVDAASPEESLGDVPLPAGYLSRLRRLVDGLGR